MQQYPHSALIRSGPADFTAIYEHYLSKGYAVVYLVERANSEQILRKMTQLGILPDVEDYVQKGLLTIINEKIVAKQKAQLNTSQLTEMSFSRASKALKKSSAKRVVVINNSDALLERGDHAKQIEFEQAINFKFGKNRNSRECQSHLLLQYCNCTKTKSQTLVSTDKRMYQYNRQRELEIQPLAYINSYGNNIKSD